MWPRSLLRAGVWALVTVAPAGPTAERAWAQESRLIPPDPSEQEPALAYDIHLALVAPVANRPVCPRRAACVADGGGGVGASIERRWPSGFAAGLGYDAWFLDSNGVFELGVIQTLRVHARQLFLMRSSLHPFVGLGAGGVVFGDTLKVSTVGVAVDLLVGVEVEVTRDVALRLGLPWRVFTTAAFTSPRDRVERAEDLGFNVAFGAEVGLALLGR